MNENIDLTKILKNCPKGTKLYCTICGEVKFINIEHHVYPIVVENMDGVPFGIAQDGRYFDYCDGECTLFPSKEQRDWSKFTAPWYKKEKFDPKTLKPFDKVIVRDNQGDWICAFFSNIKESDVYPYRTSFGRYAYCVPYNDDTKYLVGTTKEVPEFYRFWED